MGTRPTQNISLCFAVPLPVIDSGKLFNMIDYPGAKHGMSGEKTKIHLYKSIWEFVKSQMASMSYARLLDCISCCHVMASHCQDILDFLFV
jgi:hypothetical protein